MNTKSSFGYNKDNQMLLIVLILIVAAVAGSLFYNKIDKKFRPAQYFIIAAGTVYILYLFFFSNFKSTFGHTAYSGSVTSNPYKTNNLEVTNPTDMRLIINMTAFTLTYSNSTAFKTGASAATFIPPLSSTATTNNYIYQVYDPNYTINHFNVSGTNNTIKTYKNNNCDLAYIFYDIVPTVFLSGSGQTINSATRGNARYTPFINTGYYDLNIAYGGLANCPGCLDVLTKAGNSGLYKCSVPNDFDSVTNVPFTTGDSAAIIGNTANLICKNCNTNILGAPGETANAVYINASKYNIYFYDKSGSATTPTGLTPVSSVETSDGTANSISAWMSANSTTFSANPGKTAKIFKFAPGSTVAMKDLYVDFLSGLTGNVGGQNYFFQANYQLMPILWPPHITKVYNRFRGTLIEKIEGGSNALLTYRNIPSMG